jgi:hypothetical protein
MTSREDIVAAIRESDARIDRLRDRIVANADTPLATGSWRVRDALSHLAARANGVDRVVQRARAVEAGTPMPAPSSIDDINAGQVEERQDRSIEEILDEIRAGHAAATDALTHVDDELLAREIPMGFRPGEIAVADMMIAGGPGHENRHLDEVEAALPAE